MYADDNTKYASDVSTPVLEYIRLWPCIGHWPSYRYNFSVDNNAVVTTDTLKILGITLDCKLNFTAYVKEQAKKACAKTSALKRIRNCSDLQHLSQLISDCQSCLAMTEFQILFFLQYLKHSKILPKVRLSFPQKNRKTSAVFDVSS